MAADDWPPGQGPGLDFNFTSGDYLTQEYSLLWSQNLADQGYPPGAGAELWPKAVAFLSGPQKRWAYFVNPSSWLNWPPLGGIFIGPGHYMIEAFITASVTLEATDTEVAVRFGGGLEIGDGSGGLLGATFAQFGQSYPVYLPGPGHSFEYDATFQMTRFLTKDKSAGGLTLLSIGAQVDPPLAWPSPGTPPGVDLTLVSASLILTRFPDQLAAPGQVAAAAAPGAVVRRR